MRATESARSKIARNFYRLFNESGYTNTKLNGINFQPEPFRVQDGENLAYSPRGRTTGMTHSQGAKLGFMGRVWENAREHASNAVVGGAILVVTGFTPEHWVAE